MMLGAPSGAWLLVAASRFFLAVGVVVAGLCAALPFRQSSPVVAVAPPAPPPLELPLRRPDSPLEMALRTEVSPAVGLDALAAAELKRTTMQPVELPDLRNLAPPPALPVAFQPLEPSTAPGGWRPDPMAWPSKPSAKPRPYRLRDGDTLESVAERYLGDRERAAEIFELNRDVLPRPDLLPVGVTIVIPPRGS
jgi:nucleoid-associated protein YgaU